MILNAEQEEYLPFITPSAGLIVNIHSPDNIPWARESGIVVSPGFNTEIAVEIVSVNTLRDTYAISIYWTNLILFVCLFGLWLSVSVNVGTLPPIYVFPSFTHLAAIHLPNIRMSWHPKCA